MSKQEARLPDYLERAITYLEEANCQTRDAYRDNLRNQIRLALDEARDEALAIVKHYHHSLGPGKKDCCDRVVDVVLIEVESALKSKRGA